MNVTVNPAYRVLPGAKALGSYQHTREITRWANENEPGAVSPVITVDNKYFFVVTITAEHEAGIADINDVATQIKQILTVEKQGVKVAEETKALVEGVADIDAVAEKLGLTVSQQNGIAFASLTSQQLDPKFIGAIAAAKEGELNGPVVGDVGVYYFVVNGKETGAFYTEDDARNRKAQEFAYMSRLLPVIMSEEANVVDQRYKFF
jgi:peptidyl-prolyl cis-trans isomerase D